MRNYERFLGLMETLFEKHVVPDEKHPLLSLRQNTSLNQVVEQVQADAAHHVFEEWIISYSPRLFQRIKKTEETPSSVHHRWVSLRRVSYRSKNNHNRQLLALS